MSSEDLTFAVVALSAVFFVVDLIATVPVFISITARDSIDGRRQTARQAALAAAILLSLFAAAGGVIFQAFGITLGAFKIAGPLDIGLFVEAGFQLHQRHHGLTGLCRLGKGGDDG